MSHADHVSRKTKKNPNRFRKVQNYQTKLGEVTCFVSGDNKLLIFLGFELTILNYGAYTCPGIYQRMHAYCHERLSPILARHNKLWSDTSCCYNYARTTCTAPADVLQLSCGNYNCACSTILNEEAHIILIYAL